MMSQVQTFTPANDILFSTLDNDCILEQRTQYWPGTESVMSSLDVSHPNPLTFNYPRPGQSWLVSMFERIMVKLGFKLAFTDPVKE